MSTTILLFAVLLVLWAVVSKVVGCGLGAKLCRYSNQDALRIGVGMISRGEVALIVANNGIAAGLMKEEFFGPVVLMVIATTILTPGPAQAGLPRQRARLQRSAGERAGQRLRGRRRLRPGLPGSAGGSREPEAIRQEKITV